ncbi:MAG: flagellar brake protein [bacterium]
MTFLNIEFIQKIKELINPLNLAINREPGELKIFGRIAHSFTGDRFPIEMLLIYVFVFFLILGGIVGLIWLFNQISGRDQKKITVLEALQENYQLSSSQERYLEALIEKFKNRNPHDPEISSDYMQKFLEYVVQNLTHAPDQTLRRQVHHVPRLEAGQELQIMYRDDGQYKTQRCEILDQKDKYITLRKPDEEVQLSKEQKIEVTYRLEDLHYRGDAEIRTISESELIVFLPQGLRFEEKRVFYRLPLNSLEARLTLQCAKNNTVFLEGTLEDISAEGACMLVEKPEEVKLKKHLRGTLEFDLPGFRTVDIRCEVVRAVEKTESYELGLKFVQLSVVVKENIINFIHKRQPVVQQAEGKVK